MADTMFAAGAHVAKAVAISAHPPRHVHLPGSDEIGMRLIEQLIAQQRLLKLYQVRRGGIPTASRAAFDFAR